MGFAALILAAGAGTRMKSARAKVAHELLGKPLVRWVVDAARSAGATEIITVLGHGREQVEPLVADTTVVIQEQRLGTGHAIMIARDALEQLPPATPLVVLNGDTPLISAQTIAALSNTLTDGAALSVLTFEVADATGYGRVIRSERGDVLRIVEEKDATAEERQVRECNSGAWCFDLGFLLANLDKLSCDNSQREYYLTDMLALAVAAGRPVQALKVDAGQAQGINSRLQLAQATKTLQRAINIAHMEAGVTMTDPDLVWIGPEVTLEEDVELKPMTFLVGKTFIGGGSEIGPNSRVVSSYVGRYCKVDESVLLDAVLEDGVNCGPRAYLRPGTVMKAGSKAGTHVEIKNSVIGENSKVPHLSYIGDARLGSDVNIGAGSITCNFDGVSKHPTEIGNGSFIGSDTMLVAPVRVGAEAVTGAGSTITTDVPDGALAVERNKQEIIENWAERRKAKKDS
ncbi:MAG: bifunctional UDP-N-acetylglucosamine diphosphorylase/glucosamine-1-phosphate N-acetyltransferase GlmU [Coriobacteriales bacterium]|jgi:bifunctional UDP-N-acetylglucosamine pyrophosphorylase/glucosamine-1-phosphate N-acetyltransferase|nr:bifunctional UDP-N-acetylglucosamine diphosphorylase/glucosamine-1-phosphate N-acetyltransferase GlmU [Coriobacteriales bacterium]